MRISSFGQQQVMMSNIFRNQQSLSDVQRQITTGKESDEFRGLAGEANTSLGSRSFLSRVETYQDSIKTVRGKVEANDVQVGGMIESMESLKEQIQLALSSEQAEGFDEILSSTFQIVVNGLNTNFDGGYLFAGSEAGQKPVNLSTLADLQAASGVAAPNATAADVEVAFDNSDTRPEARIADGVKVNYGVLGDDLATEAFAAMLNLYNFDQGADGPLQGEINDTQYTFLQGQLAALDTAIDGMREHQVANGLVNERLDVVDEQHVDTAVFLETFIADVEDVDLAEAISRLNSDQLALEASYRAMSSLNRTSLLDFL